MAAPGRNLPRARPLTLVFVGALLLIMGWAVFTLVGGVEFRDLDQPLRNGDPGKLKTPILAQSFVSPHDNLSRVELPLAQPVPDSLPPDMRAMLVKGEGLDNLALGETVFGVPEIISDTTGAYLSVKFPPILHSQGVTYTFMLSTPGYSVNSVLSPMWSTADALSSGAMYTEDGPQTGDLGITTFYRYTLSTMLSDVWRGITGSVPTVLVWLMLLLLPGLAILLWLPNSLNTGQRLLAAPALSALLLPLIFLMASLIDIPIGRNKLWALLAVSALAIAIWIVLARRSTDSLRPSSFVLRRPSAFWLSFAAVLVFTTITRLVTLRDIEAGVGMDAYHHTLITALFLRDSGIPGGYAPFVPLDSFTYHFGFHTLASAIAWLTGNTLPAGLMGLVPQVGQVAAGVLAIPALTLFGWRVLGNRWLGLTAAALAGLLSVVPAFYIEWSRYTQGLGLAVLPVAWVLFVEAVRAETRNAKRETQFSWSVVGRRSSVVSLAALASAGLFLTHYRITVIYAVFAILYVLWATLSDTNPDGAPTLAFRASRFITYAARAVFVAALSLILLLPWLLNFLANFRINVTGREIADIDAYYATAERLGGAVLGHPSLVILADLCALGLMILGRRLWRSVAGLALGSIAGFAALGFALYVWTNPDPLDLEAALRTHFLGLSPVTWFLLLEIAIIVTLLIGSLTRASRASNSREAVVALPVLTWLALAVWSSPQLFPIRLPYSGYLDAVTLVSGAWLPACLLAAYALTQTWQQLARLAKSRGWMAGEWRAKERRLSWLRFSDALSRPPSAVLRPSAFVVLAIVLTALASGIALSPIKERRPYIEPADMEALLWMRDNLPGDSYVLANSFSFPWSPTQALGLDSGLWVPLVTGLRSSVPPINAYNEQPADDQYFDRVLALSAVRSLPATEAEWQALRDQGITHIYIGSRAAGAGFSAPDLLNDPHVELLFHRDAVWLFALRGQGSGARGQGPGRFPGRDI